MNQIILNNTLTSHPAQTFVRNELLAALATPISQATKLACKHLPAMVLSQRKVEEITAMLNKCQGSLSAHYTKIHKMMLHHLSAIMDRSDLLASLCPKKLKMPKDNQGYTPLHFRALLTQSTTLETDPYYKQFQKQCLSEKSNLDPQTKFGQTPQQLFNQATSLDRIPSNQAELPTGFTFDALTGNASLHDPTCWDDRHLVNQIVATRKSLFQNWQWMEPSTSVTSPTLLKAYEKFLQNPPQLAIQPTGTGYCGAFSAAPIKKHQIVFAYDGEMTLHPISNSSASDYYFSLATSSSHQQVIDAVQYRSIASMANDGPPNLASVYLFNKDGLNQRLAFFALKDLEPNEELLYCYGPVQVIKGLDYQITAASYQNLVRFLQTSKYRFGDAAELMLKFTRHVNNGDASTYSFPLDKRLAFDTFQYIINTPVVCRKLIEDEHLQEQDYRKLISEEMLPFFKTIPMLLNNLLDGFLWLKFNSECKKKKLMPFFNKIAEIQRSHFSRFMKAHLNYDLLGRSLQTYRFAQSLKALLEGLEKGVDLTTLKKQFEETYIQSDLFEDASRQEKEDLSNELLNRSNNLAFALLKKYHLISF